MTTKETTARLHRFGEKVALRIGEGATHYLSAELARDIAAALNQYARDVENVDAKDSMIGTMERQECRFYVLMRGVSPRLEYWRDDKGATVDQKHTGWTANLEHARRFDTKEEAERYRIRFVEQNREFYPSPKSAGWVHGIN